MYILFVSILIGSTGFIGGHLRSTYEFDQFFHKSDINEIKGMETDFLICAGLPAEKWKANENPHSDWMNVTKLAQNLSTVRSKKAVLISTIDVYQPAIAVNEKTAGNLDGHQAYGRNRAWFEFFFRSNFKDSLIIRLPGVYGHNLKKNFIFDLLQNQTDQIYKVNQKSSFQFFNIHNLDYLIQKCLDLDLRTLNVSSRPLLAQEIADLFGIKLYSTAPIINYDMRTLQSDKFGRTGNYLYSCKEILEDINKLRLGQTL